MSTNSKTLNKNRVYADATWHVLLVEDQVSLAKMTASMLKARWQCHVTIANTYQHAQKLLVTKADAFFLVVADLNLPDAPNGEIIDLLNEYQKPIIAITGHFDKTAHQHLDKKGVIDYVLKKNINAYEYLSSFVGRLYHNQTIKVLVIDDSESLRQMIGHHLKRQFLNISYASNGEEGLEKLKTHTDIKLVLVDAEMPVMDGLTFTAMARQIKAHNALTIIGISSAGTSDLSTQFLKHGANDFISKPFSYEELACRVNQNLNLLDHIAKISELANVDFLTQLPNRRFFLEKGRAIFNKCLKESTPCLIGILDIDHFKSINDQYGHDCGDYVLQLVSTMMQHILEGDHIARIGGEEFGFILHDSNIAHCIARINILHETLPLKSIDYQGKSISVTASVGITSNLKTNLDETLIIADKYLYNAKANGRNQIASEEVASNLVG